jgi:hypothetical protein
MYDPFGARVERRGPFLSHPVQGGEKREKTGAFAGKPSNEMWWKYPFSPCADTQYVVFLGTGKNWKL